MGNSRPKEQVTANADKAREAVVKKKKALEEAQERIII